MLNNRVRVFYEVIDLYIDDTIAAISTPPGEGGIGIVRINGEEAAKVAQSIFKSVSGKKIVEYRPRNLIYGHIVDGENTVDEVLVAYMKGPNSYTKEDMIEINCHGGFISVKKILELVLKNGARIAEPGEFTKRAFLNGRIDLSQAEAVIDIIHSKTDQSYEIAQSQLEGSLSRKIKSLRRKITELLAHVEVSIDFPEEDIEEITSNNLLEGIKVLKIEMESLYDTADTGKILREGLKTAIVGKPNVGKSSLLNALLRESRAIVTDIAGTTRDVIEEYMNIKGVPIKLVDTAGIRQTEDVVEKIGVERSKEMFKQSDLVILVVDSSSQLSQEDMEILEATQDKKAIILINKSDLQNKLDEEKLKSYAGDRKIIKISALENVGIEELEDEIVDMVYSGKLSTSSDVMITKVRHKNSLEKSIKSAQDCINGLEGGMPIDFVEIDLKNIWDCLGEVTGETVSEDLLDTIFSEFCIGK